MKKFLALLLALVMCISLAACSGGNPGSGSDGGNAGSTGSDSGNAAPAGDNAGESYKIGVINAKIDDESALISKYYQDYVGPHYNCTFVFSEACSTTDAVMTAIENFADAGCDAIISFMPTDSLQQALLCQEKGMAYNFNGNRTAVTEETFVTNTANFAGSFGADQPDTGRLFSSWMNESLSLGDGDGFLVVTGMAYTGNAQQVEISKNILTAIQESYGLTFDEDLDTLVATSSPIDATNDKGVEIYLYPGNATQDGWLQGLQAALQTGKYNYLLSSVQVYASAAVIISEVEASYNRNIVVGSFGTIGESLEASFNTNDQFGNPSVDMATVKPSSLVASLAFAEVYNHLTGNADAMRQENGEMSEYVFRMWKATSPEEYATVASWDKNAENYIADYSVIDSMLAVKNPGMTAGDLQEALNAVTFEAVLARLG